MSDSASLTIGFLGNLSNPASTENDIREGLERNGHTVVPFQESEPAEWQYLLDWLHVDRVDRLDFVLWVSTTDYARKAGAAMQWELAHICRKRGIPLVGVHADIWWSLPRQTLIETEPYFRAVDLFMSADGGHADKWQTAGVNHRWLLPAIRESQCKRGMWRDEYASEIAFVGSWQGHYHPESEHRQQLVAWLQENYGDRVKFWPQRGQQRIWGDDLCDLYASVKLVVGDSCNVDNAGYYCSDRIPTVMGRGGLLAHPLVKGVNDEGGPFGWSGFLAWDAGRWEQLRLIIEQVLDYDQEASEANRFLNMRYIKKRHTWTVRAREFIDIMREEKLL